MEQTCQFISEPKEVNISPGVVGRNQSTLGTLGTPPVHFNCFNDLEYKTKFTINGMNYVASYKCFQQLHKFQKYDYFSILARNRGKLLIVM